MFSRIFYKPILPIVDFTLSTQEFNRQAFNALKHHGAYILTNMGSAYNSNAQELFFSWNQFVAQDESYKRRFRGTIGDKALQGYYDQGVAGRKPGSHRTYFIPRNPDGTLSFLPKNLESPVEQMGLSIRQITAKTIDALESGLGLRKKELKKYLDNPESLSLMDQTLPVTQEMLEGWIKDKKLTCAEDGEIESFLPHTDIYDITVLTYENNNCEGFRAESYNKQGEKTFQELRLTTEAHNIQPVVIAGSKLQIATDNLIPALRHSVIAQPLKKGKELSRNLFSHFINAHPKAVPLLRPIVKSPYATHVQPENNAAFFQREVKQYLDLERKGALPSLPKEKISQYPKKDEIEEVRGVFRRKP